jgi:hypothetical protein
MVCNNPALGQKPTCEVRKDRQRNGFLIDRYTVDIGHFYGSEEYLHDAVKAACDARVPHDAEYRRLFSTKTTLGWRLHRARVDAVERVRGWRSQTSRPSLR